MDLKIQPIWDLQRHIFIHGEMGNIFRNPTLEFYLKKIKYKKHYLKKKKKKNPQKISKKKEENLKSRCPSFGMTTTQDIRDPLAL